MIDSSPKPSASRPLPLRRSGWISLAVTLVVWVWYAWPLPLHIGEVIPSHTRRDEQMTRAMIPGDHLQLMYHFWLLSDFIAGETPWFHNLYEFNTGDDAARFRVNSYFVPASLFFAVGRAIDGDATGWNLAFFTTLWLGFWAAWRLARRFVDSESLALLAALPAVALPYRWAALCDGSPTGFAMMWVPLMFLGAAAWVLDGTRKAAWGLVGAWIGLALGEAQSFFLTTLALPPWVLLLLGLRRARTGEWVSLAGVARRTLPLVTLGAALACGITVARLSMLKDSVMKQGRAMAEVAIFSPRLEGFWTQAHTGISSDLFLGWPALLALVVVGGLAVFQLFRPGAARWEGLAALGLVIGTVAVGLLCLGTNGPLEGRLFDLTRRFVPKFSSIRQPLKLVCLFTALLPVLLALLFQALRSPRLPGRLALGFALLAGGVSLAQYKGKISPTLCGVDRANAAYAAVADDCDRLGKKRQVLALPLWPGESSWGSLYQHYNSIYRLRGLNGYSPMVAWSYFMEVFQPLRSLNQGHLDDGQIELLTRMGVRHLVLHENAFPNKVSPWPVAVTLAALRNHPRLDPVAQDGEIHAFRILDAPRAPIVPSPAPRTWFPSRHFGAEAGWPREVYGDLADDPGAGGGKCVPLRPAGRPLEFKPMSLTAAPNLRWHVRARGTGTLRVVERRGGQLAYDHGSTQPGEWTGYAESAPVELPVQAPEWTWVSVPGSIEGHQLGALTLTATAGECRVDEILLTAGEPLALEPGHTLEIPAADFFHAGFSQPDGSVVFRQGRDPRDVVLYGPDLPLAPGEYEITAHSDAPSGATLGGPGARNDGWPTLRMPVTDNRPIQWRLRFLDERDVTVRGFTVRRR